MAIFDILNNLSRKFSPSNYYHLARNIINYHQQESTDNLRNFNINNPWGGGENNKEEKNTGEKNNNNNSVKNNDLWKNLFNKQHNSKNQNIFPKQAPKLRSIAKILLTLSLLGWLSTGFYTVEPDEQGVILRLGAYNRFSMPGLNWKFPDPIETVEKVSVTRMQKELVGIKQGSAINSITKPKNNINKWSLLQKMADNSGRSSPSAFSNNTDDDNNFTSNSSHYTNSTAEETSNSIIEESQMLTGDENIVDMHFFVQWRIKSAKDVLFNIKDGYGENTVRAAAESAMREVMGTTKLYDALSERRHEVEKKAKKILQNILDKYQAGIEVQSLGILYSYVPPEVRNSYRDIQSAKADKERFINQATAYKNSVIPKTAGKAQAIIEEANSYKSAKIDGAIGEIMRMKSMYEEYKKDPKMVKYKLYVESMENVYDNVKNRLVTTSQGQPISPIISMPTQHNSLKIKDYDIDSSAIWGKSQQTNGESEIGDNNGSKEQNDKKK